MYTDYLILALVLYIFAYGFYILSSHGAGNKAIFLQMRRYIPCPLAAVLPISLAQQSITAPFFIIPLIIAILWILTYPALYYITNHKVSSDFEFHFDSVFGYYFVAWITSLLILGNYAPLLAAPIAVIITIIELVIMVIPIAQIVYFMLYGSCINESGMQMIQDTYLNETLEFIKSMPLLLNIFSVFSLGALSYYVGQINYQFLIVPINIHVNAYGILLVLAIAMTSYLWKYNHGVFVRTGIVEFYLDVKSYRESNKLYLSSREERMRDLEVKTLGHPFNKPSTIILVIGESASRDYMKAINHNYAYNTTPWLSEADKSENFTIYPHAYSVGGNTVLALSRALTEFNQYDNNSFNQSCSIVDIAQKAGYKVHWYSNQGHIGSADTPITLVAETSDVSKWTKQGVNKIQYDESLLSYLDEVDPTKNNFVVLHLKGNHFNFLNRYPESFTKFGTPGKYDLELNYANSIAYTDYVLQQIYEFAKDKLNLQSMVYFSDHATIPDKRRSPNFQGFAIVRIPFFTYFSDEYIEKNPKVYNALKVNKDKYWTNDLAYELMCSIFNISSNRFKEENSIASKKYKFKKEDLRTNLGATSLAEDK